MKWLIFALITSHAMAMDFSWTRSTPKGLDQLEIVLHNKVYVVKKNSNWFDPSDMRLGTFKAGQNEAIKKAMGDLGKIEKVLARSEAQLNGIGSSLGDLSTTTAPHAPYFTIGKYTVRSDSGLYEQVSKIAKTIATTKLPLESGVELSKDKKEFLFFAQGKQSKKENFNVGFFCESTTLPSRCLARQYGALYLE